MDQQENKLIILEGPQGVGKSFLLNSLPDTYKKYKFLFTKHSSSLDISEGEFIFGMNVGKDLTVLEMFNLCKETIVIDRGFLSTSVWNNLLDRVSKEYINKFINYIKELITNKDIHIVFIYGKNDYYIRNKNDGYNNVSYELQVDLFQKYMNQLEGNIVFFKNEFNENSVVAFRKMMEVINEH